MSWAKQAKQKEQATVPNSLVSRQNPGWVASSSGSTDANEYEHVVLGIIFLRRISGAANCHGGGAQGYWLIGAIQP